MSGRTWSAPGAISGNGGWSVLSPTSSIGDAVEVRWRSFELDPNAPAVREGDPAGRLARKYGISVDEARAGSRTADIPRGGRRAPIPPPGGPFRQQLRRSPPPASGRGSRHAGSVEGATPGRLPVRGSGHRRYECAACPGRGRWTEPGRGQAVLESDAYAEDVRADEAEAAELEITGVPFFLVGVVSASLARRRSTPCWPSCAGPGSSSKRERPARDGPV